MSTTAKLRNNVPATESLRTISGTHWDWVAHASWLWVSYTSAGCIETLARKSRITFLRSVYRGVPALFRKIDINRSAVDTSICLHQSEWQNLHILSPKRYCFRVTSRGPCWCPQSILRELHFILVQRFLLFWLKNMFIGHVSQNAL